MKNILFLTFLFVFSFNEDHDEILFKNENPKIEVPFYKKNNLGPRQNHFWSDDLFHFQGKTYFFKNGQLFLIEENGIKYYLQEDWQSSNDLLANALQNKKPQYI